MSALARLYRTALRISAWLVAAPILALWLLGYLVVATVAASVVGLVLMGILGSLTGLGIAGTIWETVFGLALFAVAWLLAFHLWAERTGVSLWFRGKPEDTHGSARFAEGPEIAELRRAPEGSLLIGRDPASGDALRYDGPAHLLTLAPTRSGKGVGTVIPNLLTALRSVIVIDPKGENARITAARRAEIGPVHVLDPFGLTGWPSAACNPLDALTPDSLDLGEDAATLADALVMDPAGQIAEPHWNEEAKALLTGLILFAACHEEPGRRTLASVREYLTLPQDRFHELLGLMQESPEADGLIARAANRFLGKADREAASVMSNAQRHTHFLDSRRITDTLARTDFDFAALQHGIGSVFLVLPPDRLDTYARWLRLLIAQALRDIGRDAASGTRRPEPLRGPESASTAERQATGATTSSPSTTPHSALGVPPEGPTLFLLDEFAALGRLEAVERAMGLMAGYGLQLWPILQDLSQLKGLYGPKANTFVANAGVLQTFGVNDLETAEWLSRAMGRETIETETRSHRVGDDPGYSISATGRELMTSDEIMRLPAHLQLLRLSGRPPLIARKIRYFEDPAFAGLYTRDAA